METSSPSSARLNWVQYLERCTAECLTEAMAQTTAIGPGSQGYKMKVRVCCEDQAKSNEKSAQGLLESRNASGDDWERLHFHCEVHVMARCMSKVLGLVPETISGQIHYALSVNFGTNLTVWQQELRRVIRERVVVKHGEPPEDAIVFRKRLLQLCLSHGTRRIERLLALTALANGDWRNRREVEVYVPTGAAYSLERLSEVVAIGLAEALSSAKVTMFPRHRWTKADEAMGQVCLLEGVHGLGSATYPRFQARLSGKVVAADPACQADVVEEDGAFGEFEGPGFPQSPQGVAAEADCAIVPIIEQQPDASEAAGASAADNERHRSVARAWFDSQPFAECVLTRAVLEPLRTYLSAQLRMGSESWEREQQVLESSPPLAPTAGARDDRGGHAEWPTRDFRVLNAAKGTLDDRFKQQTDLLLFEPAFIAQLLPPACRTMGMRSLAFRLVSSSTCWVHEGLASRHSRFPMRLFSIMASPSPDACIAQVRPCLLDPFSARFVGQHAQEQPLDGEVARRRCSLIMQLVEICISRIEVGHASLRRHMVANSVQTHGVSLEAVSAEKVFETTRHTQQCAAWFRASERPQKGGIAPGRSRPASAEPPQRRGAGGGPWRAFVRRMSLGTSGRPDTAHLSQAYQCITPDEKEELNRLGDAAREQSKLQSKSAGSNFGMKTRDVVHAQARRLRDATLRRLQLGGQADDGGDLAAIAQHSIQHAASSAEGLSISLQSARQVASWTSRKKKEQHEADCRQVTLWSDQVGAVVLADIIAAAPQLRCCCRELAALPSRMGHLLMFRQSAEGAAGIVKLVGLRHKHTNLGTIFDSYWQRLHMPNMQEDCAGIKLEPKKRNPRPPCYVLGVCACSPDGMVSWKLRNRFLRTMKKQSQKGNDNLAMLQAKEIVVKLEGHREAAECPWATASLDADDATAATGAHHVVYWHVGAHSFSPYRSTFKELRETTPPADEPNAAAHEIVLEALIVVCHTWVTYHQSHRPGFLEYEDESCIPLWPLCNIHPHSQGTMGHHQTSLGGCPSPRPPIATTGGALGAVQRHGGLRKIGPDMLVVRMLASDPRWRTAGARLQPGACVRRAARQLGWRGCLLVAELCAQEAIAKARRAGGRPACSRGSIGSRGCRRWRLRCRVRLRHLVRRARRGSRRIGQLGF